MLHMKWCWCDVKYPHSHTHSSNFNQAIHKCCTWNDVGVMLNIPSHTHSSNFNQTIHKCCAWNDVGVTLNIILTVTLTVQSNYLQMLWMKWCWFDFEYNPHNLNFNQTIHKCYAWNDFGSLLNTLTVTLKSILKTQFNQTIHKCYACVKWCWLGVEYPHSHTHSSNYPQKLCMKWCWFDVEYNPHSHSHTQWLKVKVQSNYQSNVTLSWGAQSNSHTVCL